MESLSEGECSMAELDVNDDLRADKGVRACGRFEQPLK